ncbi:MAG: hypothetical protein FRX49_02825 [Trebouxia sp. A1-2]|nr:MAG: hypothetical protein FRX49_02825 [Trebouxia sp. A1-2]
MPDGSGQCLGSYTKCDPDLDKLAREDQSKGGRSFMLNVLQAYDNLACHPARTASQLTLSSRIVLLSQDCFCTRTFDNCRQNVVSPTLRQAAAGQQPRLASIKAEYTYKYADDCLFAAAVNLRHSASWQQQSSQEQPKKVGPTISMLAKKLQAQWHEERNMHLGNSVIRPHSHHKVW